MFSDADLDPHQKRPRSLLFFLGFCLVVALFVWRNQTILQAAVGGFDNYRAERGGDSDRYTDGANVIIENHPFVGKQANYAGYCYLLVGLRYCGYSYEMVAPTQVAFAALATFLLYLLGRDMGGRYAGLLAAMMMAENPDLAIWNNYILTDSLYTSMLVVSLYTLSRTADKGAEWYLFSPLILVATALIRPNGWLLIPIGVIWIVWRNTGSRRLRLAATFMIPFLFVIAAKTVPAFDRGVESEAPAAALAKGTVIWGWDGWDVDMPPPTQQTTGWMGGLSYALTHPLATFRLASVRVGAELVRIRPYYPTRMNLRLGAMVAFLYFFAFIGLYQVRNHRFTIPLLAIIGAHLALIAATFGSYDGRFLLYILPLISLFSATGLVAGCSLIPGFGFLRR